MINTTVRVLVLTLMWAALQGSFSVGNVLLGLLLGLGVVLFSRPLFDASDPSESAGFSWNVRPIRRTWRVFVLLLVFLRELVTSSIRVARYVLQPRLRIRSAIVAYPLDVQTDREITALANLITLTPGTMTLDVDDDRSHLFVHTMSVYSDDGDELIDDIKGSLEKHVRRALGPATAA